MIVEIQSNERRSTMVKKKSITKKAKKKSVKKKAPIKPIPDNLFGP